MRIVHVVQRFHPAIGGTETHVREVVHELVRRGHDVTVVTSGHPDMPAAETVDAPSGGAYRVRRFEARRFKGDYLFPPWLPMRGVVDFLVKEGPDLIHAHAYRFHTLEAAAEAGRRTGAPVVMTAHGFYPPENAIVGLSRRHYDRTRGMPALAQAARVIAVSSHERAHYEALGVDPARIDVVPNGIPADAFFPCDGAAFRARNILGDDPVVLFLARLAHDKGLGDIIRAWPAVIQRHPDATLVVCGRDAGARASAVALARKSGIAHRVRFVGEVPDPREAYAASDVFVLPSHYEAFGIVLLEAMAQNVPVIATTAGGMPDVVGENGRLVPPHDPAALADAIVKLLDDPAGARALGQSGRQRARGFLWKDVVDRIEETYARAIA